MIKIKKSVGFNLDANKIKKAMSKKFEIVETKHRQIAVFYLIRRNLDFDHDHSGSE